MLKRWGAGALGLLLVCHVNAANVNKDNNADVLENGSSWVGGIVPSGTDIAVWDAQAGSHPNLTLNNNLTVEGVYFNSGLSSDVTIDGSGTLILKAQQLNSGGVAKNITFKNNIVMDSSNGWTTFTVASGGTMTIGGAAQKGATFSGAQTWQKQGAGVLHVTGVMQDLGNIRFDSGGGAVTISGTVLGTGAASIMSNNSAAQSTVNLTGNGKFAIGGQLAINNNNMHLDWNMDGNSELSATNLYLGWNSASNEVLNFNQSGGTVTLNGAGTGFLNVMNNNTNATTTAAYNLNGGVLGLKQAIVGTGGALKLNGGTVKLLEGGVELFKKGTVGGKVIVSAGGAIIDTNGLVAVADAVNALPLEHDVTLSGKDGGLKVIGGGALLLSKVNTYDGGTVIENAILSVGADATLGSGDVVVGNNSTLYLFNNAAIDSGATLSFGSGVDITLGYNGTLTLAGLYDQTANHWFDEGEYLSANLSAYGFSGLGSLTVIPEPSTWLLMITGAGLLTVTRRRRG